MTNPERIRQSFGSLDPNDIAAGDGDPRAAGAPGWRSVTCARRCSGRRAPLVLVIAVIPTASRGGLLASRLLRSYSRSLAPRAGDGVLLILTLVAGAAAFMALAGSQMDRMSDLGANDYNFTTSEGRIAIWKRGIVWMLHRPWGYGIDNFPTYFSWLNGPERAAHNSLIQYGVELGVLGLAHLPADWRHAGQVAAQDAERRDARPPGQQRTGRAHRPRAGDAGRLLDHRILPVECLQPIDLYGDRNRLGRRSQRRWQTGSSGAAAKPEPPAVTSIRRRRQFRAFDPA